MHVWLGRREYDETNILQRRRDRKHRRHRINERRLLPVMIYIVATSGLPPERLADSATAILKGSTSFLAWSSILGGLCSVLGGYVSARLSKHDEVLNGGLSSVLCIGSGVYALLSGAGHVWLHLIFLPVSPALGALGGFLRVRRVTRHG